MIYTEVFKLVKDKPWKVTLCDSGTECWCRLVNVETSINGEDESLNLIPSGALSKDVAEYLVNLHNESLTKKFKFSNQDEIFEFLTENFTTDYLLDKLDLNLTDFDDYSLQKEVESRGYYYFEDEYDIKKYVEDDMDCYIFDRESEIEDWVKENGDLPNIFENHKSHIAPNYREQTLELIERLSEEKGWDWINEKLTNC